jgi:ABC-type glycerol-3-phosphate transport system substrate-binding protein
MKKRSFLKLAATGICGVFLLASCSKGKTVEIDENAKMTLSLYCMEDNYSVDQYILDFENEYKNITIDKKTFDDASKFDETVANELNGGKGPDLVLFSPSTGLDVMQMARNGAFASLNSYMEKSENQIKYENYVGSVFDAGKIGEEQYIMPLSIMIPFVQYNLNNDYAFEPNPVIPFETFQNAVAADLKTFENTQDAANLAVAGVSFSGATLQTVLLQTARIFTFGEDRKSLDYEEEKLRTLLDVSAEIEQENQKKAAKLFAQDGQSFTTMTKHFRYLLYFPKEFVYSARNANSVNIAVNQSETGISAFSGYGSDSVSAVVGTCGVVNKNAGEKAVYVYEFLRMAIDSKPPASKLQKPVFADLSINQYQIEEELITCKAGAKEDITDGKERIKVTGFTDRQVEDLKAIIDSIDRVEIINPKVLSIFNETFTPYLKGTADYEVCLTDFEQRVNLYLTE